MTQGSCCKKQLCVVGAAHTELHKEGRDTLYSQLPTYGIRRGVNFDDGWVGLDVPLSCLIG